MHSGKLFLPWWRKSPKSPKITGNHQNPQIIAQNHFKWPENAEKWPKSTQAASPCETLLYMYYIPSNTESPKSQKITRNHQNRKIAGIPRNHWKSPGIPEILRNSMEIVCKKSFIIHTFWEVLPASAKKITQLIKNTGINQNVQRIINVYRKI